VTRLAILAIAAATALAVVGCGGSNDSGSSDAATTSGDAMKEKTEGAAMKDDNDAMKHEGDSMKSGDSMKHESGDAMKDDSSKSGDAMKSDGDSMKHESGDAMKNEGAAMEGGASSSSAAMVANRSARRGKVVKVVSSDYGRVIADRKGEAFYLFGKETGKASRCYGACAQAWPPVITKGKPRARGAAKASLLGTTKRKNGKLQVTYRGHPLYYYVNDSPGNILCQDVNEFGGRWLVVKPTGNPVG
jgi:predicted lipoprotein with Yx(FWY)xxD motif